LREPDAVSGRATLGRLAGYARPYFPLVAAALALAAVHAASQGALAWLVKPLLDLVGGAPETAAAIPLPFAADSGGDVEDQAKRLIAAGLVLVVVVSTAHFGKEYLTRFTLGRILVDLQRDLCRKLLALPLGFHHSLRRGDALSRILNDTTRAHHSLATVLGDFIPAVLAVVVYATILINLSWQLSLAALAVAPLVLGPVAIFGRRVRKSARRRQETLGEVTQRLVQILSGIKIIQAFRAEALEEAAFDAENQRFFRRHMKVAKNRVLSSTVVEALTSAVAVGALGAGVLLALRGQWGLTFGDIGAFVVVLQRTYRPAKDLTKGWNSIMEALPSAERFFELLDEPGGRAADPGTRVAFPGLQQGIRLRDVHFSYGREPVLQGISLDVAAGEVVALVGRTGAGKTTLADLLLGFYQPDAGTIEFDGTDLRALDRDSFLARASVVTQEPFLFPGSIADNIRYGRPEAADAEVEAAAKAAHVDEFVGTLPDGFATEVGEAGVKLSGGQRQRVTIARAILKNPDLLVFDEATSSLDTKSERLVQEAIDRLLTGRTVIVIAHRLSTVRHADKIVVLEDGRVAHLGSHEELADREGLYRELLSLH